jgi:hypothetical protein
MDITAEQISPVAFQVVVPLRIFPKIRFTQGRLFFCCFFTVYAVKTFNIDFMQAQVIG